MRSADEAIRVVGDGRSLAEQAVTAMGRVSESARQMRDAADAIVVDHALVHTVGPAFQHLVRHGPRHDRLQLALDAGRGQRRLDRLPVRAGQWFSIRVLAPTGWWRSHPFSLSAGPDGRNLRFTIEAIGDRSKELQQLQPGTPIWLEGPYGILTGAVRTREKVLLVAGGIGVTPLRALLEVLPAKRGDLALLYRAPENAVNHILRVPPCRFRTT